MKAAEFYVPPAGWRPTGQVSWVPCSNGNFPDGAVEAGFDGGARILVARANYMGALLPGKLHTGHKTCYVAFNMKEVPIPNYEVLVDPSRSLRWVRSSNGQRVTNAVIGGHSETREQLFIGRCNYQNATVCGKVHPSHRQLYIPHGGVEVGQSTYDVLVR